MPKRITPDCIHSSVPKRLILALQDVDWKERELSRKLGVNILYISQLLRRGIEPTDKTENGRALRRKLFLPRKRVKHKTGEPKYDRPSWLYKWYHKPKDERYEVMKSHVEKGQS